MSSIPGFLGPEQLPECLKGCNVVVIPAGVPRKPGMLFFVKKTQGFIEVYLCSTVTQIKLCLVLYGALSVGLGCK